MEIIPLPPDKTNPLPSDKTNPIPSDTTHSVPADNAQKSLIMSVIDQIKLIESQKTAKEIASRSIGRSAVPWIVTLVGIGVGSSYFLDSTALTAVIGLVATATMALISLLSGITGTKDNPEITVIKDLIERLDRHEPLAIEIEENRIVVTHGKNRIVSDVPFLKEGKEGASVS